MAKDINIACTSIKEWKGKPDFLNFDGNQVKKLTIIPIFNALLVSIHSLCVYLQRTCFFECICFKVSFWAKGKKSTKTCTHGQCFEKFCFANLIKEVLSFLTSFGFV